MFAYLVIGLELALLYGVFFYVFIREPKPYNVQGESWGSYDTTSNDNFSSHNLQNEIDSLIMDARQKAIDHLGFERRVPRPAFPTPVTLSSAYDPSLYSMPSSQCTPGGYRSQAQYQQSNNQNDPRDPYLDYPETFNQFCTASAEREAQQGFLYKLLNQTINWIENISVKRP